jgi:GNAT superfamily N-acetyltransferase
MGHRAPGHAVAEVPFVVESVPATATWALRQEILRPHQTVAEMDYPGDRSPGAGHFAAFDTSKPKEEQIIGVVSVTHQSPPWPRQGEGEGEGKGEGEGEDEGDATGGWWRLRGMATVEGRRNEGIGRALVAVVIGHAGAHQGTGVWCNARLSAVDFYRAVGFETIGDTWVIPHIGQHIAMTRPLP